MIADAFGSVRSVHYCMSPYSMSQNLTTHELDSPPWLRVESTLMATARLVRTAFDARLEPLAVNLTQASLLGYIAEFGSTTQTQLADRLGIGRASIGAVVDQLEARRLVVRLPNPDDRRVWLVAITPGGSELAVEIADVDAALRAELRRGIGREERQALAWVMTRLQQNLQSVIANPPDPSVHSSPIEQPNNRREHMTEAVIVDAVRTAGGKRNGKLKDWHPAALAAEVLKALEERNNLDPALVDDVIMGCVMQVGEQSLNIGRNAVLAAGWPESVPATTIDRQCGSSQQSMHFGAQGVIAGAYDVVVAAGVEVMTRTPMGASVVQGMGFPFPQVAARPLRRHRPAPAGHRRRDDRRRSTASPARISTRSAPRASSAPRIARDEGRFENEIIPIVVDLDGTKEEFKSDEGIREGTTTETLAKLKPAFKEDGSITAGNSSQISDGASGVLIMSKEKAEELGMKPRARFHSFAVAGTDPVTMLKGPIPATRKILDKSGLSIEDIDLFEVNEAFASVVLAWQKEFDIDMTKVNVNGGAIALGHPLGCSGTKLMATLLNELERTGGRYGMQVMCEGGGMANATIIERLD